MADDNQNKIPEPEGLDDFISSQEGAYTGTPGTQGGLDPSQPPQQFLGQVIDKTTGFEKPQGDEITPTDSPIDWATGAVGARLGKALAPAVEEGANLASHLMSNQEGSITLLPKAAKYGPIKNSPGLIGKAESLVYPNGAPSANTLEEQATQAKHVYDTLVHRAQQDAKLGTKSDVDFNLINVAGKKAQLLQNKLVTKRGYAEGGEIAPPAGLDEFISSPDAVPTVPHTDHIETTSADEPHGLNDFIGEELAQQKYGTPGQQAIAGLEGAAQGVAGPLASIAEIESGLTSSEDIAGRQEANPVTHYGSQAAGLVGSSLLGGGLGAAAATAEHLVPAAVEGAGALARIGSAAAKSAIGNMVVQGSDELNKMVLNDPGQSAETALTDIGLSGLLGGALGGSGSALWHATMGGKAGGVLKALADKAGGIEGTFPDAVTDAIDKSGLKIAPEVRASLSSDPEIQTMFKTLAESDSTKAGMKFQDSMQNFKTDASDVLVRALGKDPETLASLPELSKYEAGKSIGKTLASEFDERIGPLSKEFDNLSNKYRNTPLASEDNAVFSTKDLISNKLSILARDEGWLTSPSSEIMKQLGDVFKELPELKTVGDLGNYIKSINSKIQKDPLNTSLRRDLSMVSSVFKDAEADAIAHTIGVREGADAAAAFKTVRSAYAEESKLKNAIDSRLHAKGSTSGYAKSLRQMASADGETMLNRLLGTRDADLLNILNQNFPKTAAAVRNYHIDSLIENAVNKAGSNEKISAKALMAGIEKLSPELRNFALPPGASEKLEAIHTLLEQLKTSPRNLSTNAKVHEKLLQYIPGTAIGMAAMIAGHNPVMGAVMGALTKILSKDTPDALRLSMLKFLGSAAPVDSHGFKSMVDLVHSTARGESMLARGTKNLFKAGVEVFPDSLMPSDKEKAKLDKKLKELKANPQKLLNTDIKASYYMPDHGEILSQVAATAANYLNGIRPNTDRPGPLDSPIKLSSTQKSQYDRALTVAQQPLSVLRNIKEGTITPADITTIKTIYPNLYTRLSQKLVTNMVDSVNKGELIPYKTRIGLSMFLDQPLDSTMTPGSMQSVQASFAQNRQASQQEQQPKGKHSLNSLNKMPSMYKTSSQKAEENRKGE